VVTSSTHGAYGTPDTDRSVGSRVRRSALARSLLGLAVVLGGTLLTLAMVQTVLTTVFGPDLAAVPWWVGTTLAPLLLAGGVFGSYVCYRWLLDARLPADLSRHGAGRDLAVGLAVGAGLFTAALAVVWLAGAYGLEGSLVAVVVLALAVGAAVTLVRRRGDVVPRTWRR
jgi:hypothetical protein